ncbi:ABC transporter substrate-binding protein [bacterium]|nr:ABC transporter substrate-binding protein [bacterium]
MKRLWLLLPFMLLASCTPKMSERPPHEDQVEAPVDREADLRFAEVEESFRQGTKAEARVLAVAFLDAYANHAGAPALRLRLAQGYFDDSRTDLALHHLGKLDEDHPRSAAWKKGQLLRARALASREQGLEAASLLDQRLAEDGLGSESDSARSQLQALLDGGLAEDELREFLRRRSNSPESSRARLALARRLIAAQSREEAEPLLEAIMSDPRAGLLRNQARDLLSGMGAELPDFSELPAAEPRADLVGVLVPLSGRFSVYGEAFLEGARMALSRYNALELSNLEMVVADTKGEPVSAALAARELIRGRGVGSLLGEVLTNPTVAAAVEANARQVPMLSPSATAENIHEVGDWIFQNSITSEAQVLALARHAFYEGLAARFAVLYPRQGKGQDLARYFGEIVQELGGEMVASVAYEVGMTDFTGPLEQIRDAQPEVLFLPGESDQLLLIVPQLHYHDIYGQILGNEAWNSRRLARLGGPRVEGAIFPSDLLLSRDRPLYQEFSQLYAQRTGQEANPIAARSFLGMTTILEILNDGARSRSEIREQLALRLDDRGESEQRREALAGQVTFMTIRSGEIRSFGGEDFFRLD